MEKKWMIRMGSLWQCDKDNGDSGSSDGDSGGGRRVWCVKAVVE